MQGSTKHNWNILLAYFLIPSLVAVFGPNLAFASSNDGTINSTYKYAWSQNVGWLNFGATNGNVHVGDSALTGYVWSSNYGWINLSPSQSGVVNNNEGTLSGYAWGEKLGWINFSGVTINASGVFAGTATGDITGSITFSCTNCSVRTDWRPRSTRPACNNVSDDDGDGKIDYPEDPGCSGADDTDETNSAGNGPIFSGTFGGGGSSGGGGGGSVLPVNQTPESTPTKPTILSVVPKVIESISEGISEVIDTIVPDFLKPKPQQSPPPEPPKELTTTAPKSMAGEWTLLPTHAIDQFVFAPLPREIRGLAEKFPQLATTFEKLGVTKMSDLEKLKHAKFVLPGLNEGVGIEAGARIPLAFLTKTQRNLLPSEIIFAKSGDFIDYSISLAITDDGKPEQRINTIAGKSLDLAVKVDKPVKRIKGYLTVKNLPRQMGKKDVPASSLLGAPIAAALGISHSPDERVPIDETLVVSEFEYADENNDGIYTAKFQAPQVHGEYEIISIVEYKDTGLGKKELRLIAVVDPEGYIYEANGNKETRIPNTKVSLFWKNPETGQFELWPAKEYQQVNPQKTDKSGTYSFLVPEGVYKLTISSSEHYPFDGQEFTIEQGRGVHENIQLQPKSWWRSLLRFLKLSD